MMHRCRLDGPRGGNLSQPVECAAGMFSGQVPWPPHLFQTQPPPCLFLSSPRNFQTITDFPGHQPCSPKALWVLSHRSQLSSAKLSLPLLVSPDWKPGSHTSSCLCPGRWQHLTPDLSASSSAVASFIPLGQPPAALWPSSLPLLPHFQSHQINPSSSA